MIFGTSLKFAKIAKLQLTSHTNSYSCISCMTCVTTMEILSWSFRMIQLSLLSFRYVFHGPLDSRTWSWMRARVTLSLDGADLTTISPLPKPTCASLPLSPGSDEPVVERLVSYLRDWEPRSLKTPACRCKSLRLCNVGWKLWEIAGKPQVVAGNRHILALIQVW